MFDTKYSLNDGDLVGIKNAGCLNLTSNENGTSFDSTPTISLFLRVDREGDEVGGAEEGPFMNRSKNPFRDADADVEGACGSGFFSGATTRPTISGILSENIISFLTKTSLYSS